MRCFPESWLGLVICDGCQVRILSELFINIRQLLGRQDYLEQGTRVGHLGSLPGQTLRENLRAVGWYNNPVDVRFLRALILPGLLVFHIDSPLRYFEGNILSKTTRYPGVGVNFLEGKTFVL